VGCYIWYSEEGTGRGPSPARPLLAVPNVTAHPSVASVPITVLLYNGPLLCGFNVAVKGLKKAGGRLYKQKYRAMRRLTFNVNGVIKPCRSDAVSSFARKLTAVEFVADGVQQKRV